jgi:hypothetical protein
MSFSDKLIRSLASDVVQEKIFEAVVKPVFNKALEDLGAAFGTKVGELINDIKQELQELQNKINKHNVESYDQGVAATAPCKEAARPESSRAHKRRQRRNKCAANHNYAREVFLKILMGTRRPVLVRLSTSICRSA